MRDSVPSASYSSVCNVLRQWNIPLIPTYRVYRLYDNEQMITQGTIIAMLLKTDMLYNMLCKSSERNSVIVFLYLYSF